jgi:phenylpropionate dioxygenase-like ring-hydroxylating dioxygenase large terminal subunit
MEDFAGVDYRERRQRIARDIQRRLVAHIAAGGTTDFAASPMENDASAYTDPTRAQLETDKLFLKLPLLVVLSQDAPRTGDCLLFEEVGFSIVVVRGTDGLLRAFRNMCAHRGSKIVRAKPDGTCDQRTRLTCPFHAWSYNLDGTLAGVPGRTGFDGIDLNLRKLIPVAVAEWRGFVFLRLAGEGPIDIQASLGPFAPELAQLELENAMPLKTSGIKADTNWKYAVDTYGEGYHFGSLHASTIGTTHYSNVAAFDQFGDHWRINFAEKSLRALVGTPESDWPEPDFGGVHFLFPNTILVASSMKPGKGFVRIFRLFPGPTPGTTSCRVSVYAPGGFVSDEYRVQFANDNCEDVVTQEDYSVAVEGHKNLAAAPAGFKIVYGRNEIALQAFHRSVETAIGISRPTRAAILKN